jgi:hypothetical protein
LRYATTRLAAVWVVLLSGQAIADTSYDRGTIGLLVENDSFLDGIDRHYTSGLNLSWTGAKTASKDAAIALADRLFVTDDTASATFRQS